MIQQKDNSKIATYWNTTGDWRLTYFENLKKTPDENLNFVLRAEKEVALTEERVFNALLADAQKILELGCGVGRSMINEIVKYPDKSFVGVDISPYQIKLFQEQIESKKVKNARAFVSDVGDIQCLDEKFDLIIMCNHTFGNLLGETRNKALKEISRLLSQSGKIMLSGFTNIEIAEQCYNEWNVKIENIDYETGFCRLENYNSYWQKQNGTNSELLKYGFRVVDSIENTLGFVNTYSRE